MGTCFEAWASGVASGAGAQHPHPHSTCAAGTERLVSVLLDCQALEEGACPEALVKAVAAQPNSPLRALLALTIRAQHSHHNTFKEAQKFTLQDVDKVAALQSAVRAECIIYLFLPSEEMARASQCTKQRVMLYSVQPATNPLQLE